MTDQRTGNNLTHPDEFKMFGEVNGLVSSSYSVFISHIYRQNICLFTFTFSFGLSGKQYKFSVIVYNLTRVQLSIFFDAFQVLEVQLT